MRRGSKKVLAVPPNKECYVAPGLQFAYSKPKIGRSDGPHGQNQTELLTESFSADNWATTMPKMAGQIEWQTLLSPYHPLTYPHLETIHLMQWSLNLAPQMFLD